MSIDLGQIIDAASPYLVSLIETSGTTGSIIANPGRATDETVGDDLSTTDPTPDATFDTGVEALVLPDQGSAQQPAGPGLTLVADRYRILLLPDQDLPAGLLWLFRVDESLDPQLVGRRFVVERVQAATPGLVRVLETRPETTGA